MSTNPFHSPFRSHLLQQWARTTKRPPVAVVPWLRPHSEEEEALQQNNNPRRVRHHHHHHHRDKHHTQHNGPPTLSSVDSNSHSISSSSWSESRASSTHNRRHSPARDFSSLASLRDPSASSSSTNSSEEEAGENHSENEFDDEDSSVDEYLSVQSVALQSLIMNRRTATRLTYTAQDDDTDKLEAEKHHLLESIDRAVQCAQMAPNHKRTEPFTFKRFLSGSQAAQTLADIAFQVSMIKSQSLPNAESKRKKWLNIPAFIVASVHNNQNPIELVETTSPFELLTFNPPETERQLEDYASASAAIQNVLLSLHSEGIGSKWATGPVIQTKAFRELVQADPSDRIAGLIMVGGTDSTKFQNEREEIITKSRRHRRRSLHGDLLQDLP